MNSWSSGDCYSLACCSCRGCRVFCRGGCSKCWAWAFWQDVWSGAEEHRCYQVAVLLWENDLCVPLPLCLSMLPVPSFFSRSHAGIKRCHLPRWCSAGVPSTLPKSCPPQCLGRSSGSWSHWKEGWSRVTECHSNPSNPHSAEDVLQFISSTHYETVFNKQTKQTEIQQLMSSLIHPKQSA